MYVINLPMAAVHSSLISKQKLANYKQMVINFHFQKDFFRIIKRIIHGANQE